MSCALNRQLPQRQYAAKPPRRPRRSDRDGADEHDRNATSTCAISASVGIPFSIRGPVSARQVRFQIWNVAHSLPISKFLLMRIAAMFCNCRGLLARNCSVAYPCSDRRQRNVGGQAGYAVLKSSFGLDDGITDQLIDDAAAADRSAIDLYHFTRQLNRVLDDEGRRRIVKMMWEVVYVDESVNEFESNIIWRTADLLGVSSRQRIELRQRIAADRAALA
jgi:uncharacterized tellurite resistance protein B-like protein